MDEDKKLRTIKAQAIKRPSALAPSSERRAFLTVIGGSYADLGKHIVVENTVLVGRAPSCDLILQDPGVSWRHASINPLPVQRFRLDDHGSTNGTRVHGKLIEGGWMLNEGETFQLHNTLIRFTLADAQEVLFHQEVAQLVGTDPLTGLMSKRRFDDTLEHTLQNAQQDQAPLALIMMDMDGVKTINDTHGHLFGAHAIATVGRIIQSVIGSDGQACRFGGDEFIAFLPHQTRDGAAEIAERIRFAVETAGMVKDEIPLSPTISIGFALFPRDGEDAVSLIRAADEALYQAKALGRNQVCEATHIPTT